MSYQKDFFHRKVILLYGYFWALFSELMITLFWVFNKIFMRYYSSKAMNSACFPNTESATDFPESFGEDTELKSENFGSVNANLSNEINHIDCISFQPEEEAGSMEECSTTVVEDSGKFGLEVVEEKEPSNLVFKFQYQSWNCNLSEEPKESNGESCDFVKRDILSANTNKYQFLYGMSFSHFLDEPQAENFIVKELFIHSNDDLALKNQVTNDTEGAVNEEILDNSPEKVHKDEVSQNFNDVTSSEQPVERLADNLPSEDDFICSSIDSDSIGSIGDGFLSDTDFGTTIDLDKLGNHDEENAGLTDEDLDFMDEKDLENLELGYEPDDFAEEDADIMDELRKLEDSMVKDSSNMEGKEKASKFEETVKNNSDSLAVLDADDSNRFDTLWEHQDLIEQLKMELKKVKATGLPTILEDSESPRIMEDLKPWNIDEKFQHGSTTTNELPKFYRSYKERMRKFDILNYQKMYAIGFIQSKDPLKSFSSLKKCSQSSLRSIIFPRGFIRLSRRNKNKEADPMSKFMRELYSDLEMVYVGQLCLSWEFLQWEYDKALQLWESDQYGLTRFNDVAGEFQQFQVLLQRFIENEPFQGPRVENYTKNRCVMRNLLQVPLIRDDNSKDKRKFRQIEADDEDAITSDMLVEILEESIRTIWRFIKADKDASSLTLKGARETTTQVELQDPADSQLLVEIRTDLQKKEKRLREILKSGRCILKKYRKQNSNEEGTNQVVYFFCEVDMKLVWRVLNMSRITTDQLAWCRNKLNKITFVNRRIHVEPSFLLFPT